MTYAQDEFIPEGAELEENPEYPTAFGITFTPKVSGVICAVLGVAAAAYLGINFVKPAWEVYQEAQTTKNAKQEEIDLREEQLDQAPLLEAELQQAQAQRQQVLNLFANERTLDTLLLDLNRFIESRQGQLVNYQPIEEKPVPIEDGSYGSGVNGKLKRQSVEVTVEGGFDATRSILRNIEQLQSLLVVKDLTSNVAENQVLVYENGRLVPQGQPKLETSFRLDALLPLSEEELAKAAQEAAEEAAGEEGAEGQE
ncbi:MAG: hypothetical protein SAL07_01525 [Oscillatoria sp. PMC 1051.18]|nr:hypothetical protein [Oscillatoria sp. PMC 1050.18]MEC5028564.1 hypothetical protein [Oscillatoria sp. PMC 1051.18]